MRLFLLAVAYLLAVPVLGDADEKKKQIAGPERWEEAIQAFEQKDKEQQPAKRGIVFVGSSSIRMWDLKKSFPDCDTINRGFGGSEVSDSIHFADRIILKHEPRVVVVYAGDNDIAKGKSPERVQDDYQKLVSLIHAKLPKTRIAFIAIKPSISRWKLVGKVRQANKMIVELSSKDERLRFVDIDKPMIGDDGMPRQELFVKDGLHLSAEGYELWTSLVKPHLGE